jgi:hypothetical protein
MNTNIDLPLLEFADFSNLDASAGELLPSRGAYGQSATPLSRVAAGLAAAVVFFCGSLAGWRKARSSNATTREVLAGASSAAE